MTDPIPQPDTRPERVPPLEEALRQRFVTARMASYALAIPLHYLNVARLREQKGIPAYEINGLLRFQLDELKQWQRQAMRPRQEGRRD